MISEEQGKILHQKYTNGESLSDGDLKALNEWYAYMDEIESEALGLNEEDHISDDIYQRVEKVLEEIKFSNKRLQKILTENEELRTESELLRQKIAQISGQERA